MPRTKSKAAIGHRKIRSLARGFKFSARRRVKTAKEALLHAGQYAYAGRKMKKRDYRRLWIMRINAATRQHGLTYSKLVSGLNKVGIVLDRKILADIAVSDPDTFKEIVSAIK